MRLQAVLHCDHRGLEGLDEQGGLFRSGTRIQPPQNHCFAACMPGQLCHRRAAKTAAEAHWSQGPTSSTQERPSRTHLPHVVAEPVVQAAVGGQAVAPRPPALLRSSSAVKRVSLQPATHTCTTSRICLHAPGCNSSRRRPRVAPTRPELGWHVTCTVRKRGPPPPHPLLTW